MFDEFGNGLFMTRYPCNRDKRFEKRKNVAHGDPNAVGDGGMGVCVFVGVAEGVMGVFEGVMDGVREGVSVFVGVKLGVMDAVCVADGVWVLGWNGVSVTVGVPVSVGVTVMVGVLVMVPVRMSGVPLTVGVAGVPETVPVMVGVGVARGFGANESAMNPAQ